MREVVGRSGRCGNRRGRRGYLMQVQSLMPSRVLGRCQRCRMRRSRRPGRWEDVRSFVLGLLRPSAVWGLAGREESPEPPPEPPPPAPTSSGSGGGGRRRPTRRLSAPVPATLAAVPWCWRCWSLPRRPPAQVPDCAWPPAAASACSNWVRIMAVPTTCRNWLLTNGLGSRSIAEGDVSTLREDARIRSKGLGQGGRRPAGTAMTRPSVDRTGMEEGVRVAYTGDSTWVIWRSFAVGGGVGRPTAGGALADCVLGGVGRCLRPSRAGRVGLD